MPDCGPTPAVEALATSTHAHEFVPKLTGIEYPTACRRQREPGLRMEQPSRLGPNEALWWPVAGLVGAYG